MYIIKFNISLWLEDFFRHMHDLFIAIHTIIGCSNTTLLTTLHKIKITTKITQQVTTHKRAELKHATFHHIFVLNFDNSTNTNLQPILLLTRYTPSLAHLKKWHDR